MAKRDSYEDDDFLDEEIADWDEDEDSASADDGDIDDDDVDDDVDDDDDDDDADDEDEAEDEAEGRPAEVAAEEKTEKVDEEEAAAEEELPVEEEIDYPPDDEKALAALRKLRVRLDVSEKGNVWRAILDDTNGKDPTLVLLKGLPALKELWLLGTKVTEKAAESFREEHPKVKVYF